jgi:hypothetical protein
MGLPPIPWIRWGGALLSILLAVAVWGLLGKLERWFRSLAARRQAASPILGLGALPDRAFNLPQILWDERAALLGKPLPSAQLATNQASRIEPLNKNFLELGASDLSATLRILNGDNRWALCLSGGGIRSATFALGIIQCFAEHRVLSKTAQEADDKSPILQQFDYLSTVSGGGYIGSWLSTWLFQARQSAGTGKASDVIAELNQRIGHNEAETITNLRRNSHYLAPRFSALSGDVWSDIAAVVRNLALNWLLFIPPLILLLLLTKTFYFGIADATRANAGSAWVQVFQIVATLCLLVALSFSVANRPTRGLINLAQPQFLKFDLGVFLAGAVLACFALVTPDEPLELDRLSKWVQTFGHVDGGLIRYIVAGGIGAVLYLVSWLLAFLWKFYPRTFERYRPEYKPWQTWVDLIAWCLAGVVFGIIVAGGVEELNTLKSPSMSYNTLLGVVVVMVPWMILARIVADLVFTVPTELIPRSESNLEYQARAGGIYGLVQILWISWFAFVLFGPVLGRLFPTSATALLTSVGGISGLVALILGSGSKTKPIVEAATTARRYFNLDTIAGIAAAVFGAVLIILFSILVDWTLQLDLSPVALPDPGWRRIIVFAIVLVVLTGVMCLLINVNRYSLHGLYRNRLVRAFLGASRGERRRAFSKNQFTDFDSSDTPLIHQLWERDVPPIGDNWKPLHIINVALNLVSSKNLAWQERMAAPFTFSPLHAGSGSSVYPEGAFRPSYPLPDRLPYGGRYGLTLGTAMAISGAAVSPSMGYNSSPGTAFLMTLFNVRLGWWLANPGSGNSHYWYTGPGMPLRPFLMEMFGLTSETEPWVYLSDGGHFENLGLYEMVRRRCRLIVVSDAGCDPEYQFDDLGNAMRKIWIDLGIRIDFVGLDRLKKRFKRRPTPAKEQPYWAVGQIRYHQADGTGEDGLLLYIKAGLHGTECMDVLSYASTHAEFPHETTANQFFTESQFESYRALGFEIAYKLLCYAERSRVIDAPSPHDRADDKARPIDDFNVMDSSLRFDHIVWRLRQSLLSDRPYGDGDGRARNRATGVRTTNND